MSHTVSWNDRGKMEKADRVAQLYGSTDPYKSHRLPSGWYKSIRALSLGVATTTLDLSFVLLHTGSRVIYDAILQMYEDDYTSPLVASNQLPCTSLSPQKLISSFTTQH